MLQVDNLKLLTGAPGIEPGSGVLETLILPMNYAPMYFWHAYIYIIFMSACQQKVLLFYSKYSKVLLANSNGIWYNVWCYADVAELADALDLGSSGRPWGFESLHPHANRKTLILEEINVFFVAKSILIY